MARLTAVPMAPEELSTCSRAGEDTLEKGDRALGSEDGVLPPDLPDLRDRLFDPLDRRLGPPAE